MAKRMGLFLSVVSLVLIGTQILSPISSHAQEQVRAPAFTHAGRQDWINSLPLQLADLRGDVVLVDFWTSDCWNCYRSFPWLNAMERRLAPQGLRIIGVHTPEFDREKVREHVMARIAEFKLKHPVMVDNDRSYWRAMHNQYWPAYYLIDKKGYVRAVYYGETHAGDRQAGQIEGTIRQLLSERPD